MGLCSKLFYDPNNESETLHGRSLLSAEQISYAVNNKNQLLDYLKPELKVSLGVDVKHWLQGSYKNHTIIRPVRKGDEFDIDVGIYLFCNAEHNGWNANDIKNLNRRHLEEFVECVHESQLADSKESCERIIFPKTFHIDIPIYYIDEGAGACKLATQNNGWVDSDPKALQDWFDNAVENFNAAQLAQLRRIIKYFKVWVSLKWKSNNGKIPSIAITILVVNYFVSSPSDDDSFIETAFGLLNYILSNDTLPSPINGDNLLGLNDEELDTARRKSRALLNSCEYIKESTDSFQQFVLWSASFEHIFPPFTERLDEIIGSTNLPAVTIPPKIRVRHLNKTKIQQSNSVTEHIRAFKDEGLYFSVDNSDDYGNGAEVHWMVRNQEAEAYQLNDLGHTKAGTLNEEIFEECRYNGIHYMECLIMESGNISGISSVKVNINGYSRPVRNPPRKKIFKGR